jgi:hypothetical protein
VTLTLDTRARMLLLVLLFVLAASVAAFMAMRALHKSDDDFATQAPAPVHTAKTQGTSSAVAKKAVARHAAPATHPQKAAAAATRHPTAAVPKPKPKPTPKPVAPASPNELPLAIRKALAHNHVVVVALYDPTAKIDGAALAEAKAGAKLGKSAFVPIDVRRKSVDSLNARYGAVHDPAVLVLRPGGALVVRIDGFADKDTVAQAALNARS